MYYTDCKPKNKKQRGLGTTCRLQYTSNNVLGAIRDILYKYWMRRQHIRGNKHSSKQYMSSQWRGWISHEYTPTEVTLVCYGIMHKKYLSKYLSCGKLNLWHTLGIAAQHTLVEASRTDTTLRCSHFHHDPACLTWGAIALRCTVNSLHSWCKLPSTLTTYHTAYFSFSLPCYAAYSRARISAKFNYVERGLRSIYISAWLRGIPMCIFKM